MHTGLLTAAILAAAVGIAHSLLGERYILIRLLRRSDLPRLFGGDRFTRQTLRFAWHLTSVAWWGFAAILAGLALPGGMEGGYLARQAIAGTFLVSAAITASATRGRHLAWIVLLAIALLCWTGGR